MSLDNNFCNIENCSKFSTFTTGVIKMSELSVFSVDNNNFLTHSGPTGPNGPTGFVGSIGYTGEGGLPGDASPGFVAVFGGKVDDFPSYLIYNGHKDSPTNKIISNKNIFFLPVDCLLTYITYNIKNPNSNATINIITNSNQIVKTISCLSNFGNVNVNSYFFAKGSRCQIVIEGKGHIIDYTNIILYFS